MSQNNAGSSGTTDGSGSGQGYEVTGRGTNTQGNAWDSRDYGRSASNSNTYHYSNANGSYHYSNPNGSTYTNYADGSSKYTPPSGK